MEGCLLCFQKHKEHVGYISVSSTFWLDSNVNNIIEKHLWPIETIQPYSWICKSCWKALYDFNNYYMMIDELHNKRHEAKPMVFQYEPEEFLEQNFPDARQQNTTNTKGITKAGTVYDIEQLEHEDVIKLEELENCINLTTDNEQSELIQCDPNRNGLLGNENENNLSLLEEINNVEHNGSNTINFQEEDIIAHSIFAESKKRKRGRPSKGSKYLKRGRPPGSLNKKKTTSQMTEYHNNSSFVRSENGYEDVSPSPYNNRGRPGKNTQKFKEHKRHLWEIRSKLIARPKRKRKLPIKLLNGSETTKNGYTVQNRKLYAFVKSVGKRGRPRKIFVSNLCDNQDPKACKDNMPFKKTGKRGRPRKYFSKNLEETRQENVGNPCDSTVSSSCENDSSVRTKNKPGRPRKDSNKYSLEQNKNKLWTTKSPERPIRKRKLPRKYFSNEIQVTDRFLLNNTPDYCTSSTNETLSNNLVIDKHKFIAQLDLIENCNNKISSKSIGKHPGHAEKE